MFAKVLAEPTSSGDHALSTLGQQPPEDGAPTSPALAMGRRALPWPIGKAAARTAAARQEKGRNEKAQSCRRVGHGDGDRDGHSRSLPRGNVATEAGPLCPYPALEQPSCQISAGQLGRPGCWRLQSRGSQLPVRKQYVVCQGHFDEAIHMNQKPRDPYKG